MKDLCYFLNPLQECIEKKPEEDWPNSHGRVEAPYHRCNIKKLMGDKDTECPFSSYTDGHRIEAVIFDRRREAEGCPLYTIDSGERSNWSILLRGLKKHW
jgi:hypothetical protein